MIDYIPKQASEIKQGYNKNSGLSKNYKIVPPLSKYKIPETYTPKRAYETYKPKMFYKNN